MFLPMSLCVQALHSFEFPFFWTDIVYRHTLECLELDGLSRVGFWILYDSILCQY